MNLAAPAPAVETAISESAPLSEKVIVETPELSDSVHVSAAGPVKPASCYDPRTAPRSAPTLPSSVSVAALRGTNGFDFESYAAILRGAPPRNILQRLFPCIFDERDFVSFGECKKYILLKGGHIFVYNDHDDPAPLYAIPLHEIGDVILEDPKKLDKSSVTVSPLPNTNRSPEYLQTILVKYRATGKQAYQLIFDNRSDITIVKRFMDAVERGKKEGSRPLTASVLTANEQALWATKYQPDI